MLRKWPTFISSFFFQVDSYSAFFDNGGFSKTDLESKLEEHGVHKVFVSGLALDFCVFYSAMDADHLGKSNLKNVNIFTKIT